MTVIALIVGALIGFAAGGYVIGKSKDKVIDSQKAKIEHLEELLDQDNYVGGAETTI